jgi:hypothetical protein
MSPGRHTPLEEKGIAHVLTNRLDLKSKEKYSGCAFVDYNALTMITRANSRSFPWVDEQYGPVFPRLIKREPMHH